MDEPRILSLAVGAGMALYGDGRLTSADGGCVKRGDLIAFARLVAEAERGRCLAAAADDRDSGCFDGSFVANSIADAIRNT